ncbi:MAG: T9SS type A sorting domain-containing protein [Bacteroidia bacterium]
MLQRIFTILVCSFFTLTLSAQNQPEIRKYAKKAEVNVGQISEDYSPLLQNLEMPKPGADTYYNYLQRIKNNITRSQPQESRQKREMEGGLEKGAGFEIFPLNIGVPNDNDMAISNGGLIVAVQNTSLTILDSTGKELKDVSLAAFSTELSLAQHKYDPRVLYDPETDRFIVVALNGSDDSTNFIVVAFSQTNDPVGVWNLYTLPGNPLGDSSWSDYPIIALHNGELFLTINALQNNKSWQEGFKQSFIWQIDKKLGYEGKELATKLHTGNSYNGKFIRNLCAVQGGSKPGTGTAYFVSTRNFSQQSDSVFMISLTGNIYNTNPVKNITLLRSQSGKYGVPPGAQQIKDTFQTNDARVLDAVMEKDKIHLVGNSVTTDGRAGVFHGIINNYATSPQLSVNIISDSKLEFGYPSIAYAGRTQHEDAFIIFFNHTADTIAAGNSAILYNAGVYSNVLRLKQGTSYVNAMNGRQERWGDYSGAQLRYNQPGKVWVGGYYGYKRNVGAGNIQYLSGTFISEVENTSTNFPTSVAEVKTRKREAALLYPSPVEATERINIEFTNDVSAYATFEIFDMRGNNVALLLNERVKTGKNKFSFSTGNLKPGQYILRITKSGENIVSQKFMVK